MVKNIALLIFIFILNGHANKITDSIYWVGSASASSIGFAQTAKTNAPESIFFNPAGLNTTEKSSINASYSSIYDTNFSNLSYVASNQIMSFGIGFHTNQSSNIEKTTFNDETNQVIQNGTYNFEYSSFFISAALQVPYISFAHLGGSLHFHRMSIASDTLSGRSINFGAHIRPFSFISVGLTHHNVIPLYLTWLSKNEINTEVSTTIHRINTYRTLGIEFIPIDFETLKWVILVDYEPEGITKTSTNNYSALKYGTEIIYKNYAIKAGNNYRYLSFGLSIKLNQLQLNYSFLLPNEKEMLENRHAIGLNYFL